MVKLFGKNLRDINLQTGFIISNPKLKFNKKRKGDNK